MPSEVNMSFLQLSTVSEGQVSVRNEWQMCQVSHE